MIELTQRQIRIMSLLIDGKTPKEISAEVGVKVETVRKHVKAVSIKLGASTLVNAAALFIRGAQSPLFIFFMDPGHFADSPKWSLSEDHGFTLQPRP